MSSLPGQLFRWSPITCTDATFTVKGSPVEGSMATLSNLIPDPTTTNLWVPRPAATQITAFPGFTTPGFVSGLLISGGKAYGMISTGRFAGHDEPFCYDLVGGSFITISGVTSANTPLSPNATGAWTPPILSLVGQFVVVCHPGFDGVTNFVGWIDLTTISAPVWSAGNTSLNGLPSVAVACAQYAGRAWYVCNPANANPSVLASDSLAPKVRSNGTFTVSFGDNEPLTAIFGQPLANQLGGVIQSLLVFKSNNIFQVSGEFTTNDVKVNALNIGIGTRAPLSLAQTPNGTAFVARDGLRFIDYDAKISEPVGLAGVGITQPFANTVVPSRIVAVSNATTLRVATQNGGSAGSPVEDWWYNFERKVWCGPHTFPASVAQPNDAAFLFAPVGVTGSLWTLSTSIASTTTYTENGTALSWAYKTSLLPPEASDDFMTMNAVIESQLWVAFSPASATITVTALDESGAVLNSVTINGITTPGGVWGTALWGSFLWGGIGNSLAPRRLPWTKPLVFTRLSVLATGSSSAGVKLGDLACRIRALGYVSNV